MAEPPQKKRKIDWTATFRPIPTGERRCTECGFLWYKEELRDNVFVCGDCRYAIGILVDWLRCAFLFPFQFRGKTVDPSDLEYLNRNVRGIIAEYLEPAKVDWSSKLVYVDEV